jgi:GH15 family glucan-1,4-alpha-glucosidase
MVATPSSAEAQPEHRDTEATLHDYGLIGNEKTGALVSRFGSVDWACLPRFDSPSVFARLLDRKKGGYHHIAPVGRFLSHQQYVTGTNVLATIFEIRKGVSLTLTDFMPMGPPKTSIGGDPRIIRRMTARGAAVDVSIGADARFDYGRAKGDSRSRARATPGSRSTPRGRGRPNAKRSSAPGGSSPAPPCSRKPAGGMPLLPSRPLRPC